ncbi:hypothetical protein SteCoe_29261 [Stentor coeruleus]|uniref:Uncharacterized protein n=1 Tax=Stentor coeruleus TaxID=5963 RepID=A0A1R2B6N1_9CILI|nr:hypothetical protein SteCoe_29261 [Stentor coeruleus]
MKNSFTRKEEFQAKVVIVGDSGSGKSSIITRYINGTFDVRADCTIGASFYLHTIEYEKLILKLYIWDTAGQERYDSISALYSRNSKAVVLVADATHDNKVETLSKWYNKIVKDILGEEVLVFVAINKTDLTNGLDEFNDAKMFAESIKAPIFFTSAKNNLNITELFVNISDALTKKYKKSSRENFVIKDSITLSSPIERKKKCC